MPFAEDANLGPSSLTLPQINLPLGAFSQQRKWPPVLRLQPQWLQWLSFRCSVRTKWATKRLPKQPPGVFLVTFLEQKGVVVWRNDIFCGVCFQVVLENEWRFLRFESLSLTKPTQGKERRRFQNTMAVGQKYRGPQKAFSQSLSFLSKKGLHLFGFNFLVGKTYNQERLKVNH